jgi:putative iron-dependent peroxidase
VAHPQTGIFALGTVAHVYLEFDLAPGASPRELVDTVAALDEPRTTMGGINLVAGFRPELWREVAPDRTPPGLSGFEQPVVGPDGYTMPATQRDLMLWVAAGSYDVAFDAVRDLITTLRPVATLRLEVEGWSYHRDLDLTGFVDGTENPTLSEAPSYALVPDNEPGAGGSVLLLQQWAHDSDAWSALSTHEQEQVIGRTKPDSIELDPKPETSHAARTDQDDFGHVFRRNTAYGSVTEHGTMFVGFCATQEPLATMLDSMAGIGVEGDRDALTRFTTALTGSYFFVPSLDDLAVFAPAKEDD